MTTPSLRAHFAQFELRRLVPLRRLIEERDFVGDLDAALARHHAHAILSLVELDRPAQSGGREILAVALLHAAALAVEKQLRAGQFEYTFTSLVSPGAPQRIGQVWP